MTHNKCAQYKLTDSQKLKTITNFHRDHIKSSDEMKLESVGMDKFVIMLTVDDYTSSYLLGVMIYWQTEVVIMKTNWTEKTYSFTQQLQIDDAMKWEFKWWNYIGVERFVREKSYFTAYKLKYTSLHWYTILIKTEGRRDEWYTAEDTYQNWRSKRRASGISRRSTLTT